ncbi:hypothetical protein GCM10009737_27800 [Nocardioides lentus]|uniref:DUF3515 domain-containing protein n=1 Tax=Nocardioides lentus TaxID=338077 RepID=A0ABP5AWP5_9ACTN
MRRASAVAGALLVVLPLAGCTPTLQVDAQDVGGTDAELCARLVDAVPDEVVQARRRDLEVLSGTDATVAAWGDPPLVLTCGVGTPAGFSRVASACQDVAGVDWFVPEEQMEDQSREAVATTIGFEPAVELRIPAAYRPPVEVLVELAPAIRATLRNPNPCVVADPRDELAP